MSGNKGLVNWGVVNLSYKGTTKVLDWTIPVFEGMETEWDGLS